MSQIAKMAQFMLSNFPSPVKNMIRKIMPIKLKRIFGRQIMAEAIKNGGTITVRDGRKFNVIEDRLFLRVYFEKDYEPLLSSVAIKLVDSGDVILDVGANFGWYSTLFNRCASPGGAVVSYEPSPHSYKILVENIKLNEMEASIEARPVCVGNASGVITLEQGFASESGLAHVVTDKAESTIEVAVVALDEDLSDKIGRIAYIKIDVEGYEYSALEGASQILDAADQPIIQIELNDEALERAGTSRAKTVNFLKSRGYSFWEIVPGRPGMLKETDAEHCSDVFCFGRGIYGERIQAIVV